MTSKVVFALTFFVSAIKLVTASDCQVVECFETLKSKSASDKNLRIGPGGFFADAADGGCYFLSADQAGFKEQYPSLAAAYSRITSDTSEYSSKRSQLEERATPGCGQACTVGDGCLFPCYCQYDYTWCNEGDCFTIYTCQS